MDSSQDQQPAFGALLQKSLKNKFQQLLDKSVPQTAARWVFFSAVLSCYLLRVYYLEGFYIVTYGLGLSLLNLLIGFLSPLDTPSQDLLPNRDTDEFKPFVRKLSEFNFWKDCTSGVLIAFFLTFFSIFNVPVFWPILLIYFCVLFFFTMKKQISHMRQHNYVPCNWGKKKYQGGSSSTIVEDIRSK